MDEVGDTPGIDPRMMRAYPTPVMTNGAVLMDEGGRVWCIVSFQTPNATLHLMMSPDDMVKQGEELSRLGIDGRKKARDALILPRKGGLVIPE